MIPVARRRRCVCAARKASATAGSSIGCCGGAGEGGTCGSGSTTCSPVQTDSKPAASAARATFAAVSGTAHGPVLMPKMPSFTASLLRHHAGDQELREQQQEVARLDRAPHVGDDGVEHAGASFPDARAYWTMFQTTDAMCPFRSALASTCTWTSRKPARRNSRWSCRPISGVR